MKKTITKTKLKLEKDETTKCNDLTNTRIQWRSQDYAKGR